MGCIHVEEAIIWGREIRTCAHKRDKSGSCVNILEENWIQIDLIKKLRYYFMKCNLDLYFQGQLMQRFCCQPHLHHLGESFVKISRIVAEI